MLSSGGCAIKLQNCTTMRRSKWIHCSQINSDSVVRVNELNVTNITKNTNCEMLCLCDLSQIIVLFGTHALKPFHKLYISLLIELIIAHKRDVWKNLKIFELFCVFIRLPLDDIRTLLHFVKQPLKALIMCRNTTWVHPSVHSFIHRPKWIDECKPVWARMI